MKENTQINLDPQAYRLLRSLAQYYEIPQSEVLGKGIRLLERIKTEEQSNRSLAIIDEEGDLVEKLEAEKI